jgi:hypothetical protein
MARKFESPDLSPQPEKELTLYEQIELLEKQPELYGIFLHRLIFTITYDKLPGQVRALQKVVESTQTNKPLDSESLKILSDLSEIEKVLFNLGDYYKIRNFCGSKDDKFGLVFPDEDAVLEDIASALQDYTSDDLGPNATEIIQ